jgi:hypothetical protein
VDRSVFPERTLVTEVEMNGYRIRTFNFHSITGVGYNKAKSSNFATIADYLESDAPDFMCCDANEPEFDSLSPNEVKYWNNRDNGKCAAMVFSDHATHSLRDSYKAVLSKSGTGVADEKSPLAISHVVRGRARRYDHIYHSPRWCVDDMTYDYESAITATSDHAIVVADFTRG